MLAISWGLLWVLEATTVSCVVAPSQPSGSFQGQQETLWPHSAKIESYIKERSRRRVTSLPSLHQKKPN